MTDPDFPIVLKVGPGKKLLALAIGVFMFGFGVYLAGREGTVRVSIFGDVPAGVVGAASALFGVCFALAVIQGLVTERPRLVLDGDGLVYAPNFGAERRIAWADMAATTLYSNKAGGGVEIQTRAGDRIKIPAMSGSADAMCDLIQRCADAATARSKPA